MPTQSVTLQIEVPEGYELSQDRPKCLVSDEGQEKEAAQGCLRFEFFVPVRRKLDPVAEWLANHPWLPEGVYAYHSHYGWRIARDKPHFREHYGIWRDDNVKSYFGAAALAELYGERFTPPPVDCLQVTRPAAQGGEAWEP